MCNGFKLTNCYQKVGTRITMSHYASEVRLYRKQELLYQCIKCSNIRIIIENMETVTWWSFYRFVFKTFLKIVVRVWLKRPPKHRILKEFWKIISLFQRTKIINMKFGNCIKAIFKMILIDSRAGQLEDCTRPRASWGLKQWSITLLILVFNLLVLILDGFRSIQIKPCKFLNPRKITIQHLNLFYRQIGPNTGDIYLKLKWVKINIYTKYQCCTFPLIRHKPTYVNINKRIVYKIKSLN